MDFTSAENLLLKKLELLVRELNNELPEDDDVANELCIDAALLALRVRDYLKVAHAGLT